MSYDLTNQKFGMLTALYPVHKDGKLFWHCRCECSRERDVLTYPLRKGTTWHCGCQNRADLTNRRFYSLVALKPAGRSGHGGPFWICRCDCGASIEVESSQLTTGNVRSCGCRKHVTKDISGERRGHLTAIRKTGEKDKHRNSIYEWRCDCGNIVERTLKEARGNECACPECRRKVLAESKKQLDRNRDPKTGIDRTLLSNIRNGKPTKASTSGIRGVHWLEKKRKWVAVGSIKGRTIHLGIFEDVEDAKKARARFVEERYGE